MAGERLFDQAVTSLAAYVRAGLPARLRAVEAEQSLPANSLPDPVDYIEANVASDLRSPLVEVFDTAGRCTDDRGNEWDVTCAVAISFSGDANLSANEKRLRCYSTAMIDTLRASATLGGRVTDASVTDYSSDAMRGDKSVTRYVSAFSVHVILKG